MSKRSYDDRMDYYMRKIEALEKKRNKRRRGEISPSTSDEIQVHDTSPGETEMWTGEETPITVDQSPPELEELQVEIPLESSTQPNDQPPTPLVEPIQATEDSSPTLDSEILTALGDATDQGPTWGQDIHVNLSQLWQPLLKKGMAKENKDKILKQYLIPSNCTLLQAPKLNIEISAAITEMVRHRDKKVETTQQQLGIGITAISRAMTLLITSDNKIEAIKTLSDGCRILSDLHYSETQARIRMITPGLTRQFLNVIQDSERDETLFGVTLPEKIKASKTIEKQGMQIKKTVQPARTNPTVVQNSMPARLQFQGNWAAPPLYPVGRGGRGVHKRYPTSSRRPAPVSSTTVGFR